MLNRIFDRVEKPAQYMGGEIGSVKKNPEDVKLRFAFCFPDLYEVGMSHLGMRILYHLLNERKDTYCERAFLPMLDMQKIMQEENIPLFALESRDPLLAFDVIGFTLQYEMCYTNVLKMLQLANIPVFSADRDENYPLICAGGPCAYNPEPIADFVDFFLIGEGEELNNEVMDKLAEIKGSPKKDILKELSKIEGVYVPSFYDVEYDGEKIVSFKKNTDEAPVKIKKRIIKDMTNCYFPEEIIIPYTEIVHDRVTLEIFRGCIRGCRFCQAGMIYRPVREKAPKTLVEQAKKLIKNSGYEEISLCSLSTSDYTHLPEFTDELIDFTEKRMINLALPSLRIDNFSVELMNKVQKVRKSGLTFAPEAGTQRMRDIINKGLTEDDILTSARIAFDGGYKNIKLYFMIGLPYETEEDVAAIPALAKRVLDVYFEKPHEGKRASVSASVSSFVPKPFTPFQFASQNTDEQLRAKQRILKDNAKKVNLSYHQSDLSVLEGVFARGDRRLGKVLLKAVELGCQLDAWSETFLYDKWCQAFDECGIKQESYTRERDYDEILPWDMIDIGVTKKFLINENEKAKRGEVTPNCREKCSGCGAASFGGGVCFE